METLSLADIARDFAVLALGRQQDRDAVARGVQKVLAEYPLPLRITDEDISDIRAAILGAARRRDTQLARIDLANQLLDMLRAHGKLEGPRVPLTVREIRRLAASCDPSRMAAPADVRTLRRRLARDLEHPPWGIARSRQTLEQMVGATCVALILEGAVCRDDVGKTLLQARTDGRNLILGTSAAPLMIRLTLLARAYVQLVRFAELTFNGVQPSMQRHSQTEPWLVVPEALRNQASPGAEVLTLIRDALKQLSVGAEVVPPALDELLETVRADLLEYYPAVVVSVLSGEIAYRPLARSPRRPVKRAPRLTSRDERWEKLRTILSGMRPTAARHVRKSFIRDLQILATSDSLTGVVATWLARLLRRLRPLNTVRQYGFVAMALLAGMEGGDDLNERVVNVTAHAGRSTRMQYGVVLGHLNRHLREHGVQLRLPSLRDAEETVRGGRILRREEVIAFLKYLFENVRGRDSENLDTLVSLGDAAGFRLSEMLYLRKYHARQHGLEWVTGSSKTAAGRRRRVPLEAAADDTKDAVQNLFQELCSEKIPDEDSIIDVSWQRRRGWREGIASLLARVVKQAGLLPFSWHDLRHTFTGRVFLEHVAARALVQFPEAQRCLERIAIESGVVSRRPMPDSPLSRWGLPELTMLLGHRAVDLTVSVYLHNLEFVQWAITESLPCPDVAIARSVVGSLLQRSRGHSYRLWKVGNGDLRRLVAIQVKLLGLVTQ